MSRPRIAGLARRTRRGMSLIEVVVAMMILTGVLLVLGNFSAKFAQANGQANLIITANEIATTRLDDVRTQPTYAALDTLATPTGKVDTVKVERTAYFRVTRIKRLGGTLARDSTDVKLMTVTVTHPAMRRTVSKSTAIAAY